MVEFRKQLIKIYVLAVILFPLTSNFSNFSLFAIILESVLACFIPFEQFLGLFKFASDFFENSL